MDEVARLVRFIVGNNFQVIVGYGLNVIPLAEMVLCGMSECKGSPVYGIISIFRVLRFQARTCVIPRFTNVSVNFAARNDTVHIFV